jgi:stage II sporulation protein D
VIDRATFLGSIVVATGGLDVWDDAPPPGVPTIRVAAGGAVVTMDLETYLRRVLPLEVPAGWPPAALQAQAIVARTYALAHRTLGRAYDVQASDADQRYGGPGAERPATDAAVDSTRGMILRYNGGPVAIFYSSCCGGHTTDAAELWGRSDLPYLHGVADDPNCVASPDYRWRRTVAVDRMRDLLGDRVRGAIAGVELADLGASGRAREVILRDGGGGAAALSIEELRRRVGSDVVRSLWLRTISIDVTQAPAMIVIEGSGRGHGVGLCQWGARGMASVGADAATILAHFFPGTQLSRG